MSDRLDPGWAEQHKTQALDFLNRSLADALRPHLTMLGQDGFLSKDEITRQLLAAVLVVERFAIDKVPG